MQRLFLAQARARIVLGEPYRPGGERGLHRASGRIGCRHLQRGKVGGRHGPRTHGSHRLGHRLGEDRSGELETLRDRDQLVEVGSPALELELPETSPDLLAIQDRDVVIDELRKLPLPPAAEEPATASRPKGRHRLERARSGERRDQVERGHRDRVRLAGKGQLVADRSVAARHAELQRPDRPHVVTGPITQRDAGPCEAEIRGVVVGADQVEFRKVTNLEDAEGLVDQFGQHEGGTDRELQLAFTKVGEHAA